MVIRKHISIERKYEKKIEPFLLKHNGNFSAAIREIIDLAVNKKIAFSHSDKLMIFDYSIGDMLLKKTIGVIPEKEILNEIADPSLFKSMSATLEFFKNKFKELDWKTEFSLDCDSDTSPTTAILTIEGDNYSLLDLAARIFSLYLAVEKYLGIEEVNQRTRSINLAYRLMASEEKALNTLYENLGFMWNLFAEIEKRPDFWQGIVKKYQDSNYKTVAIHFNTFEELLAKKTPVGEIGIELIAKRPIKDIPHREFLSILKNMYETSRVAENVDIEGDTVKVFHSYRNPKAVDALVKILLNQFKANGHTYTAKSTRNLIIFQHRPEIGMEISKIIENLTISDSNFDKELIKYLSFLNGLKNSPEISESIGILGYNMSQHIFKEFEKEHDIQKWDLKTFREAFSILDKKIKRPSIWRQIDENSICYIVEECNLVHIGGEFSTEICQLSRGLFKGALEYAFKNDVKINANKLLIHGDDKCEVQITLLDNLPKNN